MKRASAATERRKILCWGVGGVSSFWGVRFCLWLVAAVSRGVGALVVGWFVSFGSGFAGSAGRLWAFLAAVSPFSAVVPFFWLGRAFGSRFFRFCRGAAGFSFSLSFGLVGRRKKGGAVLLGVGVYPPLGGAGFAGAAAGAARLLRRAVRFWAGWRFFVGLGFLWGSVFRLRVWLGGVSSFLVAVLGLGSFLLAWSWWLRSGAAKYRRRVRRRPRYAVGLWGLVCGVLFGCLGWRVLGVGVVLWAFGRRRNWLCRGLVWARSASCCLAVSS